MSSFFRLFAIIASIGIGAVCVSGQDLGSSNKLFGGAKTTTTSKPKTVKKTTPKKKATTAKTATPKPKPAKPKATTTATKPGKTTTAVKPKTTPKATGGNSGPTTFEVRPSKSGERDVPVTAASNRLYETLIQEGNNARDDRNYSAAETAYQRARAIKPKDSRAVYGLGNLYSDQQRWEEAETAYRAALQIDPKEAFTHVALSYVLTQPLSAPNLSDRYEEAENLARTAIQLAPKNQLAFDQLGVSMELRGLIGAETENAYRRAIELDPSFAPAYAHLGRLLRRRGLTKESAAAYQNAIQRSTDVATMILVADVMQSEQRYAESERLLRKAVEGDPKNPSALLLLGRAYIAQGNFVEAESILRRSLTVSANSFMPNSLLGSLYTRQGRFEQAESALLEAVRSVPLSEKRRLSQQFEAVGDGYLKTGRRISAQRSYMQAMSLDGENPALALKLSRSKGG
ncbi:MAG TPA: tetratricopeptide repeat protein [Pyrinomonadaceae bacterium]|nr:tetratricopeptide repeat protein [Pyrinomonadaceae bacterium]